MQRTYIILVVLIGKVKPHLLPVLLVIAFFVFCGGLFATDERFNSRAKKEYPVGQSVELDGPFPARLEVETVYGSKLLFLFREIYLYGTLVVKAPEGLVYNGTTPGSLAINWQSEVKYVSYLVSRIYY